MLTITVPEKELFIAATDEFVHVDSTRLQLEHSLISISKWEQTWNKPFLNSNNKSVEETLDYIRCMTITQNVNPLVYHCLTAENISLVDKYINSPMTATTISNPKKGSGSKTIVTNELVYHWMIDLGIPVEFEKWHFNRLMTLIQVRALKTQPQKKMSRKEVMSKYAAINAARRKKHNSKG